MIESFVSKCGKKFVIFEDGVKEGAAIMEPTVQVVCRALDLMEQFRSPPGRWD